MGDGQSGDDCEYGVCSISTFIYLPMTLTLTDFPQRHHRLRAGEVPPVLDLRQRHHQHVAHLRRLLGRVLPGVVDRARWGGSRVWRAGCGGGGGHHSDDRPCFADGEEEEDGTVSVITLLRRAPVESNEVNYCLSVYLLSCKYSQCM